jgi:hypothetical protein
MPIKFIFPPVLPLKGNILHRFDFSDPSTLFADTGGITPVTDLNDPIGRVNNKGSDSGTLTQSVSGQRPLWDSSKFNNGAARFNRNFNRWLRNGSISGVASNGTYALLGYERDGFSHNSTNIVWMYNFFAGMAIRNNGTITSGSWWGYFWTATQMVFGTLPVAGTPASMIGWGSDSNTQRGWSSLQSGFTNGTGNTSTQPASRDMTLGTNETGTLNDITGWVAEFVMWDTILSDAQVDEVKIYDTYRHGTAWA